MLFLGLRASMRIRRVQNNARITKWCWRVPPISVAVSFCLCLSVYFFATQDSNCKNWHFGLLSNSCLSRVQWQLAGRAGSTSTIPPTAVITRLSTRCKGWMLRGSALSLWRWRPWQYLASQHTRPAMYFKREWKCKNKIISEWMSHLRHKCAEIAEVKSQRSGVV